MCVFIISEYLDNAANADAVKLHPSYCVLKKDMKQTLQEEAQALKTRNISVCVQFLFLKFI